MKKKLQVFISSTYTDLLDERQAAVEAILSSGHIPAGMELFAAGDESQINIIKRWIDESDIFLLILGGRYGSIESSSGKSYVHLEYEYAIEMKKPFFSIIITDNALDEKVKRLNKTVLELENRQKYKEFYQLVTSRMCSFFEDTKDIKLAIFNKMAEYITQNSLFGWISGKEIKNIDEYTKEIVQLSTENNKLRKQNDQLNKRINDLLAHVEELDNKQRNKTLVDDDFETRIDRILKLIKAEIQSKYLHLSWMEGDVTYDIRSPEGDFVYYYVYKDSVAKSESDDSRRSIDYTLIMLVNDDSDFNLEAALADIRLMLEEQKNLKGNMIFKYVIANRYISNETVSRCSIRFAELLARLKIKKTTKYILDIWNRDKLAIIEDELGLKII